jgi:hypothetical protein
MLTRFRFTSSRFATAVVLLSLAGCDGSSGAAAGSDAGTLSARQLGSGGAAGSGGSSATGGVGTPASGGATTASDAGATPPPAFDAGDITHGACCAAHASAGCEDATIRTCVCAVDPRCCAGPWNAECVALVGGLGCGTCKADCCTASGAKGCSDPKVEACVCAKSAPCCDTAWDDFCVVLVGSKAGGSVCGTCP